MLDARNQQVVLASRPDGLPVPENFRLVDAPLPVPGPGQVLLRHRCLGIAPAARLAMHDTASYRQPLALGEVIHGQAVGEVVRSLDPQWREGDLAMCMGGGWQEWSVQPASGLVRVDRAVAAPSVWLGALGSSGFTAWVGLLDIGQPRPGETVVVSAASGGVGAMAGQIARLRGCRVVGIVGGERKARHVALDLGLAAGVDRHAADFAERLRLACPEGVDLYFDNVGGAVRDAVWPLMNPDGRVVVCGMAAEYNGPPQPAPSWSDVLSKRLTVRGFIVSDHVQRRPEFLRDMGEWLRRGDITVQEDVWQGLESTVPAFIAMLTGANFGKTVVRL